MLKNLPLLRILFHGMLPVNFQFVRRIIRKRRIAVFLLVLALFAPCLSAEAENALLADLLCSVDYGDEATYVIGHKSPDADTVGAAIAYAWLLQQLGINAKAAAAAAVNRETQYTLDLWGMDQPETLSDAAGKQFVLVDHSEYSQALDGMKAARVMLVGILSDTKGMTSNVTQLDREACDSLRTIAGSGDIGAQEEGWRKNEIRNPPFC